MGDPASGEEEYSTVTIPSAAPAAADLEIVPMDEEEGEQAASAAPLASAALAAPAALPVDPAATLSPAAAAAPSPAAATTAEAASAPDNVAITIPDKAAGKDRPHTWMRWCGRDAAGTRVLLIRGSAFLSKDKGTPADTAALLEATLRDRSGHILWGARDGTYVDDPEPAGADPAAVRPFCVVYEHAGVSLWHNAPGIAWLRALWLALSDEARDAMVRCYMLHMSLDLRLSTGLFAPWSSWSKLLHVDRIDHLWKHMARADAMIKFGRDTHEHERTLDAQPLYDYGIGVPKSIPREIVTMWVSDPLGLRGVCW